MILAQSTRGQGPGAKTNLAIELIVCTLLRTWYSELSRISLRIVLLIHACMHQKTAQQCTAYREFNLPKTYRVTAPKPKIIVIPNIMISMSECHQAQARD